MGCDIHAHTEVKINEEWHHLCYANFGRSYFMFARLAGVRNCEGVDHPEPRGVPHDMSKLTRLDYESYGRDAHTSSYLFMAEYMGVIKKAWNDLLEVYDYDCNEYEFYQHWRHNPFGYCYDIDDLNLHFEGATEARIVFWFDN